MDPLENSAGFGKRVAWDRFIPGVLELQHWVSSELQWVVRSGWEKAGRVGSRQVGRWATSGISFPGEWNIGLLAG